MENVPPPSLKALSHVGDRIRKLIVDLAEEFNIERIVVGLSFHYSQESEHIFFAEAKNPASYISPPYPKHLIPAEDPFVKRLLFEKRGRLTGEVIAADAQNILAPLLFVFGQKGKYEKPPETIDATELEALAERIEFRTIHLGGGKSVVNAPGLGKSGSRGEFCLFYVLYDTDEVCGEMGEAFHRKIDALEECSSFLANAVLQAVFLATADSRDPEVEILQELLAQSIYSSLERFAELQELVQAAILHPVVGAQLVEKDGVGPKVKGAMTSAEKKMCGAMSTASEVSVTERLEGSFRKEPVVKATIKPRMRGIGSDANAAAHSYKAVIKSDERLTALQSQLGLSSLWGYHDEIREFLPQSPQYFPYRVDPGSKSVRFAVVTPLVRDARTLYSYATSEWQAMEKRQAHFELIMKKAARFIDRIGKKKAYVIDPHAHFYDGKTGIFGESPDTSRRYRKLTNQVSWPEVLSGAPLKRMIRVRTGLDEMPDLSFVNPYFVLREAKAKSSDSTLWRFVDNPKHDARVSFGHGDLHAGNILVDAGGDGEPRIVVLDYDYVGTFDSQFVDSATLETSFVLAVARGFSGKDGDLRWRNQMLPGLVTLWRPDYSERFDDFRFAHNLSGVVDALIPAKQRNECYQACRAVSLFRLIASHYRIAKESNSLEENRLVLWSAVILCGLALQTLVPKGRDSEIADVGKIEQLIAGSWK